MKSCMLNKNNDVHNSDQSFKNQSIIRKTNF